MGGKGGHVGEVPSMLHRNWLAHELLGLITCQRKRRGGKGGNKKKTDCQLLMPPGGEEGRDA